MAPRDEHGAHACDVAPQGMTDQRRANLNPDLAFIQRPKVPHKWQRILAAFLSGRSYNRFEATRDLKDWCLHSTVSTIEGKGVRIARKSERVPGYLDLPTEVTRYWLDVGDAQNVALAQALLSKEGA